MRKTLSILTLVLVLSITLQAGQAQGVGPLVIIQGEPDARSAPPQVRTYVSVIDKSLGQSVEGLEASDFVVEEAGTVVDQPSISYESVGIGIVVVIDRGGIAARGDARIGQATGLVRDLIDRLNVTGASNDDMIAVVGVGEGGALAPEEDFSYNPVDTNLVLNALVTMEGEVVSGGTPLYEGLDEAIRLLSENTDGTIRDVLARRRRVIFVFSDGIDPDFSDSAREEDIIRKARDADISIYTVGMAQRDRELSAADNLVRLAHQTYGLYQLHNNDETHQQVLNMFDRVLTQRQQYLIQYTTVLPQGDYTLNIVADTSIGSAEDHGSFSSILELPQIALISPSDGYTVTVPYSRTLGGPVTTTIALGVQVSHPDGVTRNPREVRYFANGVYIGTSTTPPTYDFSWQISDEITTTLEPLDQEYTFVALANDTYLDQSYQTASPITVEVTWEPVEFTLMERAMEWLLNFWWLLVILGILAIGFLAVLFLLVRTRGELARRVVTSTTGVLKGVTKRLGSTPAQAGAKLVILQGANLGREFRLAQPVIKVGRDPQFCDFPLYDEHVSNPHFSIYQEQANYFVVDERSTNGTRLNGVPIQPGQRMHLQPDAIIELGMTRLQFKRLGGPTRQLGRGAPPQAGSPGQTPTLVQPVDSPGRRGPDRNVR
jgi:hypothetical protein